MRSVVVGLVAVVSGAAVGCLFETDILMYTGCERADECDPAWGEKRTALGCSRPVGGTGYCTHVCERTADCPEGQHGEALACLEVQAGGAEVWQRVCTLTCDEEGSCREGMHCGPYVLRSGEVAALCVGDG